MLGSPEVLKYATRDLDTLARACNLCANRDMVVQAGGCVGVFARFLSKEFKSVFTFEPDPDLFEQMTANIAGLHNVVKVQAALGHKKGEMVQTVRRRRDGNTKRKNHEGVTHVVPGGGIPTLRLDDFNLPQLDLLVLDLEGYEMHAVLGALETIERLHPVLMLEVSNLIDYTEYRQEDLRTRVRMTGYDLLTRIHSDEIYVPRK